jgi:hypothetical protein
MNCKQKLLHCKHKFKKTCLRKKLIHKYAHIRIPADNMAAKENTQTQARTQHIKNEIKFLYQNIINNNTDYPRVINHTNAIYPLLSEGLK